ncbi:MAG: transcription-repair coupling factor [Bacteroidales bacterium]|nr:transcription-repair coupling factor [Bacteroidales bacterium]
MQPGEIIKSYSSHPHFNQVKNLIERNKTERISLRGLSGSSVSFLLSAVLETNTNIHFVVFEDKDTAAYVYNDLQVLLADNENILFFPSAFKRSVQYQQKENGNIILRANTLNRISSYEAGKSGRLIIVSYPDALAEKIPTRQKLSENTLHIHTGEKLDLEFVHEVLNEYGFELVDFVFEPGQYALRGSIVDIFSFTAEYPYRIDFFGNEVESIRSFDAETQLSKAKFDKISVLPDIENQAENSETISIIESVTDDSIIWCSNIDIVAGNLTTIHASVNDGNSSNQAIWSGSGFLEEISRHSVVEIGGQQYFTDAVTFNFNTSPQPAFNKNFMLLGDNLKNYIEKGFVPYIFSESEKQFDRLHDIFTDTHKGISFKAINSAIFEGFIDNDLNICCYTDHQIFDRYHKYKVHNYQSGKATLSLKELKDLKPGDYVVHIDHGIGRFGGLEKVNQNGKIQEAIKLVYRDNDVLFVSIHNLHRISKYKGKDDSPPKIYKLGSGAWEKLKTTTKRKVKDIAKDLIQLYAQRKAQEGFKFSPDTYLQEELEASFIYEDTPDQEKATLAVKGDMERLMPMDRLICGDVGFGKTEIAIRAAFKAVTDNKQVAVLVPTTILALQHFKTFKERLKNFPCSIDYISRLKKAADQKATLAAVAEGKTDIIIGTHKLIGKEVKFKDLGLLIVDEEQHFGVSAKEKLKALKVNVDTLTMTATPIPRTLQFSLMGARDLSVINTPPPNRHPIVTEIHAFNEDIISEGINFEVSRGGQVFFINNRIQNIAEIEALVKRLCPKVKTVIGHGQMEGEKLEQIMIDFMNGDYDVLISTTIIESGLDIPNANTIFVNNAQNFGLSDLHQLRGRVGRSNKKAFCYLLAPDAITLTPEARRRLRAIEEFSDLGSGFHIALQDLDIRGAGNMLGAEQSGYIADIGFETYNRILDEAMLELKETEFKDLFQDETPAQNEKVSFIADCIIDTDLEIHIPESYVGNIAERIRLYRELDNIKTDSGLNSFAESLTDRFGPLPLPTRELLKVVGLRRIAIELGFEKLVLKNRKLVLYFIADKHSAYFSTPVFINILTFVQKKPSMFQMKESKDRLTLTIDNISDISSAMVMLEKMKTGTETE